MNKISAIVLGVTLGVGGLLAAGGAGQKPADSRVVEADKAEKQTPVNKKCPINPENDIDPKVTTVYEGKVIGFCCADCIPEFKKTPEKYMKDLK